MPTNRHPVLEGELYYEMEEVVLHSFELTDMECNTVNFFDWEHGREEDPIVIAWYRTYGSSKGPNSPFTFQH